MCFLHRIYVLVELILQSSFHSVSMSVYLPPSPSIDPIDPLSQPTLIVPLTFEEALLISVYLATTIYGINVVLALACLRPIANPKRARNSGSLALVFNGYIFIMAFLATEATLEDALSSAANFKDRMSFTGNLCTPYALPLSILGADGFMVCLASFPSACY